MSWWKVNCGFKVNKMKQYSHHDHTERQYEQQDGNHGLFSNKPKTLGSQLSLTDAPGHLPMWLHIIRSTFGSRALLAELTASMRLRRTTRLVQRTGGTSSPPHPIK